MAIAPAATPGFDCPEQSCYRHLQYPQSQRDTIKSIGLRFGTNGRRIFAALLSAPIAIAFAVLASVCLLMRGCQYR